MRPPPPAYSLPHSPTLHCNDRFSVTDLTTDTITHWHLITAVLSHPIRSLPSLIDALETIATTLRGTAGTDYAFLRDCFTEYHGPSTTAFFTKTWPYLSSLALELRSLFPSPSAPVLTTQLGRCSEAILTRRQIACLVTHQFLCTLQRPSWMPHDGSPDFSIWFSSQQPHPKAVRAYLFSLFRYLDDLPTTLASGHGLVDSPLIFWLRSLHDDESHLHSTHCEHRPLTSIDVVVDPSPSATKQLLALEQPGSAAVISANKDIGHGRTASQEEMLVASSPELCPANLLTPTLADEEVLVVRGARAVVRIEGYGRAARFAGFLSVEDWDWRDRTVLFMDALELDGFDKTEVGVPDLLDGMLDREVRKAVTAFSAAAATTTPHGGGGAVVTGLWGCRSFGGDRYVKTLVQCIAASMATVDLRFLVWSGEGDEVGFADALRDLVQVGQREGWTVGQVVEVLQRLKPMDEAAGNAFMAVRDALRGCVGTA